MAFIRSEFNIADALTKVKVDSILLQTLKTSQLDHPVDQWIVRSKTEVQTSNDISVSKRDGVSENLH